MADRKNPKGVGRDASVGSGKSDVPDASVRKGYEAAQNPERQGDGDPGPEPTFESEKVPDDADSPQSS